MFHVGSILKKLLFCWLQVSFHWHFSIPLLVSVRLWSSLQNILDALESYFELGKNFQSYQFLKLKEKKRRENGVEFYR